MPQKFARSKDAIQQKLRDDKKGWNLAARTFIQKLIGWKKGFNGKGDPKLGIPPSDIKEPMPSEMHSVASEIEANFQQLMQAASRIEDEQAAYSAKKQQQMQEREQRKLQPKAPKQEVIPMEKPASIRNIIKKASRNEMATGKVIIKGHELDTLLAKTTEEQERGLMFRNPPVPVMSFVYSRPQTNTFWMSHTPSPLDIVFALNGKIIGIHRGEPYSTATIGGHYSDLVVELNEGTCNKLGVKEGDSIRLLT